jgi:hypothetical protein
MRYYLDEKLTTLLFVTYFLFWGFLIGFLTFAALESGNFVKLLAVICAGLACSAVMIFQDTPRSS